jgi:hypothetical protein
MTSPPPNTNEPPPDSPLADRIAPPSKVRPSATPKPGSKRATSYAANRRRRDQGLATWIVAAVIGLLK